MIEVSEFVWMVDLFVGWCYMRKGKYIVWLMCGFFICHKISVIRFPWWKGSGFKHVQAYVAKFNDSGHEGQQVQEPDAGGCLVTPVNKFLSSWDCRSVFSTVATSHLQSGIILQHGHGPVLIEPQTMFFGDRPFTIFILAPGFWPIHVDFWFAFCICFLCCKAVCLTPSDRKVPNAMHSQQQFAETTTESLGAYCETTGSSLTHEPFASFRNQHNTSCITVFSCFHWYAVMQTD